MPDPDPLDQLLEQLSSGDNAAAAEIFTAFEPYLRNAVRRHISPTLRAKFDSTDILQSVWADVLHGFHDAGWRFTDADHLRGFLFIAMRNRLLTRVRQHERAARHEALRGARPPAAASESPSAVVRVEEVWQRIQDLCPPEHHEILFLKREGYALAEIAERTGLHPDSVRRVLRTLAKRLAFEEERP